MEYIKEFLDIFLHLDKHLEVLVQQYGLWTYAILFLIVFCETGLVVTPFLPGDSLLFAAGYLASIGHENGGGLNINWMILLLIIAAILGDAVNYAIGYFIGPKIFNKEKSFFFRKDYIDKTHAFYEKYGGKTIIIARFIPIIRTFAPFVAGIGKMSYTKFAAYNVVGAVICVVLLSYAGYFFGQMEIVKKNFEVVILAIIFLSILPAVIEILRAKLSQKK